MFIVPIERMKPISTIDMVPQVDTTPKTLNGAPFADVLKQAFDEAYTAQAIADRDSRDLALGKDIDPHILTINAAKAATAIEFATELTTRAVGAYKEILGMQI